MVCVCARPCACDWLCLLLVVVCFKSVCEGGGIHLFIPVTLWHLPHSKQDQVNKFLILETSWPMREGAAHVHPSWAWSVFPLSPQLQKLVYLVRVCVCRASVCINRQAICTHLLRHIATVSCTTSITPQHRHYSQSTRTSCLQRKPVVKRYVCLLCSLHGRGLVVDDCAWQVDAPIWGLYRWWANKHLHLMDW